MVSLRGGSQTSLLKESKSVRQRLKAVLMLRPLAVRLKASPDTEPDIFRSLLVARS